VPEKPEILVVDDENRIAQLLTFALNDVGMNVTAAYSSAQALSAVEHRLPHLIIMDVMLGDRNGFETVSILRDRGVTVPILFLTARDAHSDKIAGLNLGDEYLTKPFDNDELILRVRNLLRRGGKVDLSVVVCGDLLLNEDTREVVSAGKSVDLTKTEFRLLRTLMRNADKVVTRQQILNAVWEYEEGNRASVDTYISYLRKKIDQPNQVSHITTVRGHGYTIHAPE
jgi:two-component system OmpR family response regulator